MNVASRRVFIKGAAAVAAVVAIPAKAAASSVEPLFARWMALNDRIKRIGVALTDEDLETSCEKLYQIEERAMAVPSSSMRDLALKIVLLDENGIFSACTSEAALVADARRIVG